MVTELLLISFVTQIAEKKNLKKKKLFACFNLVLSVMLDSTVTLVLADGFCSAVIPHSQCLVYIHHATAENLHTVKYYQHIILR